MSILCVVVNPGRLCYVVDGRIFLFSLSLTAPTMCVVGRVCRKGQFEGRGPATTGSLSFVSPSSLRTPGVQSSESPVEGLIVRCLGSQESHRNAIMMGKGFAVIRKIEKPLLISRIVLHIWPVSAYAQPLTTTPISACMVLSGET